MNQLKLLTPNNKDFPSERKNHVLLFVESIKEWTEKQENFIGEQAIVSGSASTGSTAEEGSRRETARQGVSGKQRDLEDAFAAKTAEAQVADTAREEAAARTAEEPADAAAVALATAQALQAAEQAAYRAIELLNGERETRVIWEKRTLLMRRDRDALLAERNETREALAHAQNAITRMQQLAHQRTTPRQRGERDKFTALPDVVNGRPGLAGVRRAAGQIASVTRAQGPPSAVTRGAGGQTKERSATEMWFRSLSCFTPA